MKTLLVLVSFIGFCLGADPQFQDALRLHQDTPRQLLLHCQSDGDSIYIESTPQRAVICFKKTLPSSVKISDSSFQKTGSFVGRINFKILEYLSTLEDENTTLREILNTPSPTKEYIFSGMEGGAALAVLSAKRVFNSLTRISELTVADIKKRNVIKLIGFYPSPVGDYDFCTDVVDSLGIANCFFFKAPYIISNKVNFPGIPLDVISAEYLRDNKSRLLCDLIYTAAIPSFIYLCSKKDPVLTIPGVAFLVTGLYQYFSHGNNLSTTSVETAYAYARESRQMYGSSISIYDVGKVPLGSVRRGILSYIYKCATR